MKSAALFIAFALGCTAKAPQPKPPPAMPAAEVKRAGEACQAYADQVCGCASPAAKRQCPLATALPSAVKLALEIAMNPESPPRDAARAQVNVRETVKECIEQTAKLPSLGCAIANRTGGDPSTPSVR